MTKHAASTAVGQFISATTAAGRLWLQLVGFCTSQELYNTGLSRLTARTATTKPVGDLSKGKSDL